MTTPQEEVDISIELLLNKSDKKLARIRIYPGTDPSATAVVLHLDIRMGMGLDAWQTAVDSLSGTVFKPEFMEEMFDTLVQGLQEIFDENGIPKPQEES